MKDDEYQYMKMAIEVAARSYAEDDRARPKVGAVSVLDGRVLGKGFRGENGKGDHAEYVSFRAAKIGSMKCIVVLAMFRAGEELSSRRDELALDDNFARFHIELCWRH